ncbi:MAG: hypothetical protein ACK4ZD_06140 [Caldimonas sp.]|uniref:DUF7210 family protein n=1 Tax=Caldimonas sp. TaxID=2838790 RepID=UPI003919D792
MSGAVKAQALRRIKHDGRWYEPGAVLTVPEAAAAALVACGAAEATAGRKAKPTPAQGNTVAAERSSAAGEHGGAQQ